jgi:hypothetical protein
MEIVTETRAMVWEWAKFRGPVFSWSAALAAEYQEAEQNGTINDLIHDWQAQIDVGKALLRDLQGIVCSRLPEEEPSLRDLLRQTINLISTLLAGIAMIEARFATFSN